MRGLVAGTVAFAVFGAVLMGNAHAGQGMEECRFQRLDAGSWTARESRRTIGCFAEKMSVDQSTALTIADRESDFYHRAYNRTGCGGYGCLGLFQHHAGYWPGRKAAAQDALDRYEVRNRKWPNPRAMSVVTFVMVRKAGWGAW